MESAAPEKCMSSSSSRNDGRDRLSELPDKILVHILSFLPIVDAVRTVLIRRFGNLWSLVHFLNIKESECFRKGNWPTDKLEGDDRILHLVNFVNIVLMLHKRISIDKFQLHFPSHTWKWINYANTDDDIKFFSLGVPHKFVKSWIRFGIDREVKELTVVFASKVSEDVLPRCVFTSQYLVMLELGRCRIDQLKQVEMRSLRKLSLTYVEVSNQVFKKIICGCPCLQELVLMHVRGLDELRFTTPNLEKLELDCSKCIIDCPMLKTLSIGIIPDVNLVDVSSVREVIFRSSYQFDEIVTKLCNAAVVKFSQGFFMLTNLDKLYLLQTRWKRLCIDSYLTEYDFLRICRLLRISPHLEEIIVYTNSSDDQQAGVTCYNYMVSLELSLPCVMPELKSVTMRGHKIPCSGMLQLAEFLLKGSFNLENLLILPCADELVSDEKHKFVEQLISFPRASTNARVTIGSEIY